MKRSGVIQTRFPSNRSEYAVREYDIQTAIESHYTLYPPEVNLVINGIIKDGDTYVKINYKGC